MMKKVAILVCALGVLIGNAHALPSISLPGSLDLGSEKIGESSSVTLTITNAGVLALDVTGITTNDAQFTVSPTSATVAAFGGTQDFTVTFVPTASGLQNATLSIAHNDLVVGSPSNIPISGTGLQGLVSLGAASHDFGDVLVGTSSGSTTISVTNTGDASLIVTGVSLSGANAGDFTVSPSSFTLGTSASQDLTIDFTPSATGARAASIDLAHDGPGGSSSIPLSGDGIQPSISLGGTLDFGNVVVDATSGNLTVSVSNVGTSALNVSGVALSGANAGDFTVSPTSFSVANGGSQDLTVSFTPSATGSRTASIDITHDAPGSPNSVAISGSGVQPAISLGGSLDFGDIVVDATSGNLTISVSNTGTSALNVTNVSLSGSHAADYSVSPTTFNVGTGSSQDLTVTFTPSTTGTRTASVDITHDAPGGPSSVSLTGNGIQPAITLGGGVNFGNAVVGVTSSGMTVSISNTGTATLNVSSVSISGTNASDFTVTPSSFSVGSGGSQDLTVTFTPSATGSRAASIDLIHDAPVSPSSISLTGTGVQPAVSLSASSIDFGDVRVGTAANSIDFTVTNVGTSDLTVSSIAISGSHAGDYATSVTSLAVAAGNSQTVSVQFTAGAAGTRSGTVTLTHDGASGSDTISLTGVGVEPTISTAASLNVGSIAVGQSGQATISVSNTGTADLVISSLAITGTNAAEFSVSPGSATVAAGASQDFTVTLTPAASGTRSATMEITHDATGGSTSVALSGSGIVGSLAVTGSLSFGNVPVATSTTKTLTMTNGGAADLAVSSITISGSAAGDFAASPVSGVISGSGSLDVVVTFTPSSSGTREATLTIAHDGPGGQSDVTLTGTGAAPAVSVSHTTLAFGSVSLGQASQGQTLTIENTGNALLSVSDIGLSGANAADYAVSLNAGSIVAGGSLTVTVTFTPSEVGSRSADLTVQSDGGDPIVVALSGTGIQASLSAPSAFDAGAIAVGQTVTGLINLFNDGTDALSITSVVIEGTHAGDFSIDLDPITLSAGQSESVQVSFSAGAPGNRSAILRLDHSAGAAITVQLTGTGVQAGLNASVTTLTFGSVAIGTQKSKSITLTNTGNATLEVTDVQAGTGAITPSSQALSIGPGQTATLSVTYEPLTEGVLTDVLTILHNGPTSPTLVTLSGQAIGALTSNLTVDVTTIDLGGVDVGDTATQTFTLTNAGTGSVNLTEIAATNEAFTIVPSSASVGPAESTTVTVTFSPLFDVIHNGTLTILHDGTDPTIEIDLIGTGVGSTALPGVIAFDTDLTIGNQNALTAEVDENGRTTVELHVSQAAAIGTFRFSVVFDDALLMVEEVFEFTDGGGDVTVLTTGTASGVSMHVTTSGGGDASQRRIAEIDFLTQQAFSDSATIRIENASFTTSGGTAYTLDQTWQILVRSAPTGLVGDFDGDGAVDFLDFIAFSAAFGGDDPQFDMDRDGSVGFGDFLIFAEKFNP